MKASNSETFNPFFIINPRAGPARNQLRLQRLISESLRHNSRLDAIHVTRACGEAMEVARKAASDGFDPIVAVGGDGTINEVANGIYASGATLAVLPGGSGNGLARHFKIPLNLRRALEILTAGKTQAIDVGWCGDRLFLVTCGVGLDALVAFEFEQSQSRGFFSYFRMTVAQLAKFQAEEMYLSSNGQPPELLRPLLITVANLNQYGGGARIAPDASATDGLLDVVIAQPVSVLRGFSAIPALFLGRITRAPEVRTFQTPTLTIRRASPGPLHLDGDPILAPAEISIHVEPEAMKLVIP
ncbi:MAG: diacylglycerol kinase family protein [bacterium]